MMLGRIHEFSEETAGGAEQHSEAGFGYVFESFFIIFISHTRQRSFLDSFHSASLSLVMSSIGFIGPCNALHKAHEATVACLRKIGRL
jgi:hypothetical protein